MMDFSNYLIVTDLDGTLFDSEQRVPERSLLAIDRFKKHGGRFTFATGRDKLFIDKRFYFLKSLVNAPVITSNGAVIYDYSLDRMLLSVTFERTFIKSLLERVYSKIPTLPIEIYTLNGIYVINPNERLYRRFQKLSEHVTFCPNLTIPESDIIRVAIVDTDKERITEASDYIVKITQDISVELVFSDWFIFEILPHGATKGNGVSKLRDILGCVKVISAGDWDNDISQLKAADVSVCPSNANENVKSFCKYVMCDHNYGLIADVVEYIEKGLFDI